ncbi:MAG: Ig-like domain-containing protein, partial [Burkholderiaceae bacterium]|nr:Ig-like domain-containing protein [Burkholderiaceae bacterium]
MTQQTLTTTDAADTIIPPPPGLPATPVFGVAPPSQNADGTLTVSGNALAGDWVNVTFGDGSSATGTVDSTGHYSLTSTTVQTTGTETVTISAPIISGGGIPTPVILTASWIDTTPPIAPTVSSASTTGKGGGPLTITGHAEAGSTVAIVYADGSNATGKADASGNYSITSHSAQKAGTETITATDAAGNHSTPTSVNWTGTATTTVTAPTIDSVNQNSNGTITLAGKAEAGDQITVTFGDGSSTTGMADGTGHYSVSSATAQATGTETVTATN